MHSCAGGRLTIDLDALVANFAQIRAAALPGEVGGVVKANAYGLGIGPVSEALSRAGCVHFFVAHLEEALPLRRSLGEAPKIYVLNGLWRGTESLAASAQIVPVLNSIDQAGRWGHLAATLGERLPAVLQFDTGMSRLGLSPDDLDGIVELPAFFERVDLRYVMTHLACADTPAAPSNPLQLGAFERMIGRLPSAPRSIASSAMALTGASGAGDLVRAGLALYGGAPILGGPNPMRPVVGLDVRVIQIREVPSGAGVGYGMTHVTSRPTRVATLAVGYADGWPRALSNRGAAFFEGRRLPIIGRVSMDSMMVDATELRPGALQPGDFVELLGPNQSLEAVAALAETIPYEILTRLGSRYARTYLADARLSATQT